MSEQTAAERVFGEDPAEVSRDHLREWLTPIDVLPTVRKIAAERYGSGGAEPLEETDLDDLDEEPDLARSLSELEERVLLHTDPRRWLLRVSPEKYAELEARSDNLWREVRRRVDRIEEAWRERQADLKRLETLRQAGRNADKLKRRIEKADRQLSEALSGIIRDGLERREELYLTGGNVDLVDKLIRNGGHLPAGISYCGNCNRVFRPRRRYASTCPDCHKKPRSFGLSYQTLPRGGYAFRCGQFRNLLSVCEYCGERFNPERQDAKTCSGRCREAARRTRASSVSSAS